MVFDIPSSVKFIIDKLYDNNFEAFMVGGCVRDCLLGTLPKDYDVTTSATPNITEKLFDKTIPTGLQHGTITVLIDGENYEVTTYRTEGTYINNRKPESVTFVSNIKEDLSRRDFTINALAYNDREGLLDYFNGIEDLNNKVIRAVGDPNIRFKEDALRMLRAIRLSCQLNFSIEENTYLELKNNHYLIKNISIERIRDELCKILISNNPVIGLTLLQETGILKIILPEIDALVEYTPKCNNHNRDVFKHTLKVIDNTKNTNSNNNLILRLSALFHDVGKLNTLQTSPSGRYYFPGHSIESSKMTKEILTRLRFDNNTINRVSVIIFDHLVLNVDYMPNDYEIKQLLNRVSANNIFILFDLQRADINSLWTPAPFLKKVDYMANRVTEILNNNEPLTIKDLNISGKILIEKLNIKPGKAIGETLNHLMDLVLQDKNLNTENRLLELAREFTSVN